MNLARQGAQFRTPRPIEAGEQVLVGLQLDPETLIECKGKVCWSRCVPGEDYKAGVRFVDLAYDEEESIECLLDSPAIKEDALAAV